MHVLVSLISPLVRCAPNVCAARPALPVRARNGRERRPVRWRPVDSRPAAPRAYGADTVPVRDAAGRWRRRCARTREGWAYACFGQMHGPQMTSIHPSRALHARRCLSARAEQPHAAHPLQVCGPAYRSPPISRRGPCAPRGLLNLSGGLQASCSCAHANHASAEYPHPSDRCAFFVLRQC